MRNSKRHKGNIVDLDLLINLTKTTQWRCFVLCSCLKWSAGVCDGCHKTNPSPSSRDKNQRSWPQIQEQLQMVTSGTKAWIQNSPEFPSFWDAHHRTSVFRKRWLSMRKKPSAYDAPPPPFQVSFYLHFPITPGALSVHSNWVKPNCTKMRQ